MASEVDICNLALGHLGDNATVASISPPEGSAQAEHCSRFYPIARDSLLEMHNWAFAMRRANLALLTSNWPEWLYAYAVPADAVNIISVLPPDAQNDYSTYLSPADTMGYYANNAPITAAGRYVPQPFNLEIGDDGNEIIYTNQENAMLRYTTLITDTTKYTPLFTLTLSYHLASMLAGPIIKGEVGAAEAKRMAGIMMLYLGQARASDSNQRESKPQHIVPWTSGR
jgi:hypothetical protein